MKHKQQIYFIIFFLILAIITFYPGIVYKNVYLIGIGFAAAIGASWVWHKIIVFDDSL